MVQASSTASFSSRAATRHWLPHAETLRWFAGIYFLLLGVSLLLLPPGALQLWFGSLWSRGLLTFASGLLLLWVAVLPPSRPVAIVLHSLAVIPHLVVAYEYAMIGGLTPAFTLLLLAVGVILTPLLPRRADGEQRPDLLGLLLGAALLFQGLDVVFRTTPVAMVPPQLGVSRELVGALLALAGAAVLAAQLIPGLPRSVIWAGHLVGGGIVLALWAAQSALQQPLFWLLGVVTALRGTAIMILPWWSERIRHFDPLALRVRLALALITAVLLPLMVALPVVIQATETGRTARSLAQQERAATIGATLIADVLSDQRALMGRLAADPLLPSLAPQELKARLDLAFEAYGGLAELALYDPSGRLLAAAAGRAPTTLPAAASAATVGSPWSAAPSLAQRLTTPTAATLVAVSDPQQLAATLGGVPLDDGARIGLVADGGQVVVTPSNTAQPMPDLDALWARGAELAADGPASLSSEAPGGVRLLGAAPLDDLPWKVVVVVPQRAVLADFEPVRQLAFAVSVLTAMAAGVGGWWLAGQLAAPIRELMLAVDRIAEGDRSRPLPSGGPTELANLSGAVGTMAAALDARLMEREQLVSRLSEQNQELREHEEAREESIRALSHDLRNPLTALSANAQRLSRLLARSDQPKELKIAQSMVAVARRMNVMIQDLADAMRIEAGTVEPRRELVDLPALVAELSGQIGDPEQAARIQLLVADEVPPVAADPAQIDRVLTNLLSNALKYAPPDTPVLVSIQQAGGEVAVGVTDRGIGMSEQEQAQLFRRYYRAQGAQALTSGLGLGLYVTRALVEAHGGRIWVESAPGQGSTFRFTLPLAADPVEAIPR